MTVNVGSITPSATYNKGKVLIVAPVGTSSGNAVETRGNTPDGISNDRTIRRLQPHGHCLDWERPGRSVQPVAVKCAQCETGENWKYAGLKNRGRRAIARYQLCAGMGRGSDSRNQADNCQTPPQQRRTWTRSPEPGRTTGNQLSAFIRASIKHAGRDQQ